MSQNGVMEYDETREENSATYCYLCSATVDANGLATAAGGEDCTELQGHCECCGAAEQLDPRTQAEEVVGFLARWAIDDPIACLCTLISIQQPGLSCRNISEMLNIPKTTINTAQANAGNYIDGLAGILGRRTASALSQQARRAAEASEQVHVDQCEMFPEFDSEKVEPKENPV